MARAARSGWFVLALAAPAMAQQFVPLAAPGASATQALAISPDGVAVVGRSTSGAWRWRATDGLQYLAIPLAGAEPTDVANLGAALTGINGVTGFYAFAWTEAAGAVGLADSAGGGQRNPVISESGSAVLGKDAGLVARRWDLATGAISNFYGPGTLTPIPLGLPGYCAPGSAIFNTAIAPTPDGSGGVGQILELANPRNSKGCIPGFCCYFPGTAIWAPPAAPHILADRNGNLLGTPPPVDAKRDLSRVLFPDAIWDAVSGYSSFGHPSGYSVTRISGDGRVIIAVPATPSPTNEGMLWVEGRGYVTIRVLLTESGCQFAGWTSLVVTGVSDDAGRVCGYGLDPDGHTQGWFATLRGSCWGSDFDRDGDSGTDRDIEAFFACLAGSCCSTCGPADVDGDGVPGTDADIEAFFRVLAGNGC